jgi:hypothetical protein
LPHQDRATSEGAISSINSLGRKMFRIQVTLAFILGLLVSTGSWRYLVMSSFHRFVLQSGLRVRWRLSVW